MKLTIIITTCNRISEANTCIKSVLNQKLLPDEIIIVDNSSKSNTLLVKEMIKDFRTHTEIKIFYYREKNKGSAYCRNLGIKKSHGEILGFLDDDCVVNNRWISTLIDVVRRNKTSIIVGKNIYGFRKNVLSFVQFYRAKRIFIDTMYIKKNIRFCEYIDTKNFVISKYIINKYNLLFDESSGFCKYSSCEDLDLSIRARINKVRIIYCAKLIAFHKEPESAINLLKREFTRGRAFYHFKIKWSIYNLIKSRLSVFIELLRNKEFRSFSLSSKCLIIILFISASLFHKIGIRFEKIAIILHGKNLLLK